MLKTYYAEFSYIKKTSKYIKYYFKNVRDSSNVAIKQFMWVKFSDLTNIIEDLKVGDIILFDAYITHSPNYFNNFKLIKPHNIRTYQNDKNKII
jgi:hypothetical protein